MCRQPYGRVRRFRFGNTTSTLQNMFMTESPGLHLRRLLALAAITAMTGGAFAAPVDGDWPMPAKDYASTRYSTLTDIRTDNAATLTLATTFSTGVLRGHEAAPIVVAGTMYIITPYPNVVYALDLSRPGTSLRWKFEPKPEAFAQGVACCDVVNRGLTYDNGRLFFNTLDNQTIALDAASGKEVWRAYTTAPDRDVLIGGEYKPFYSSERGKDLGVTTWPGEAWKIGGGTVWGWVLYDPQLDLVFYGAANPRPWNPEQ